MILIVGGGFQGKKKFAEELSGIGREQFADGSNCAFEDIFEKKAVCHFHELIGRMLRDGYDTSGLVERILEKNRDIVIVSNELGYGVVPMERFDRLYRETVGRICTQAAAEAKAVYRVVCGIGVRIK